MQYYEPINSHLQTLYVFRNKAIQKDRKRIRLRIVRRLHAAFVHFKAKQVTAVFRGQRGQGVRKIAHMGPIPIKATFDCVKACQKEGD